MKLKKGYMKDDSSMSPTSSMNALKSLTTINTFPQMAGGDTRYTEQSKWI